MLKIRILYWRSRVVYKLFKAFSYIADKLANKHTRIYNLTLEEIRNYRR